MRLTRHAFTLIELLVVVAIIAILAGISLAVIPMVRHQAKDTKCNSNLHQVGLALAVYQQDNEGGFPYNLNNIKGPDGVLGEGADAVLLCPHDESKGQSSSFNRPPSWGDLSELFTPGCSYLFEASSHLLTDEEKGWTFADGTTWGSQGDTWAKAKQYQLNFGNSPSPSAFPASAFPLVRCFWHRTWGDDDHRAASPKVLNLAWDLSIYWSIPFWEHQANPSIPMP